MLHALRAYFKKPATIIGIVTAMMFQIIFSLIWMTGYNGITDHTGQLSIAVVNEDQGAGQKLGEQLAASLPFKITAGLNLEEAQAMLERREVQMVLHVPADFSKRLQSQGQQAELAYTINESNPMMIKSMMQSVASGITATAGKQATVQGTEVVLKQANVPAAQAQAIAQGVADKVTSTIAYTNPVAGMNNQMVPMMLVLASYVGSMIMGMNLQQATMMLGTGISRWSKFGARVLINVGSSVLIALVGTSLVIAMGGQHAGGFVSLWLFQALFLLTFMFFSQMFLIVFGMAGMLFNIAMLSVQLVSSGAMVPRELLGSFYHALSEYLPATYAVNGGMNLLFGGPSVGGEAQMLAVILVVCAGVGLAATALRKEAPQPSGVAAADPVPAG
ncbi:YhgE/Pip N-terminal domain-containing protein [Paenibacillus sp. UNCCL117]|uniref:YhgE/Pip domain-containing protein n=1 Tax=unclassified Paenibacillus TaxID=185978 RepID=UPI0008905A7E|nr:MULTISPECIES: ABC transporter permease [unclassified Paenibacillus]SDE41405.1 YhgE/Pip N-terminal domain-containing protein [Paenibacillus sp. cl123]SFW65478.1 YhgE/Pip N-terminal domain-containing protein [Paenibacillus sp. UNCCL117]